MDAQRRTSGGADAGHQREALSGRRLGPDDWNHPPLCGYRKQTGLSLELLAPLERTYFTPLFTHRTVVVANAKLHKAQRVQQGLATHPRFEWLYLPTSCPDANPSERAFGDAHDKWTRTHTRNRLWHLVGDVQQPLRVKGPWRYALSEWYYTPEVTAAVNALKPAASSLAALSHLAA
jgi:hypothetical protein